MKFSYEAYGKLLSNIRAGGYTFAAYRGSGCIDKPCILRHDVDIDMEKAVDFAEREALSFGTVSTYFLLLNSDFYNLRSRENRKRIQRLLSLGHHIGLHFDEVQYDIHQDWEILKHYAEKEQRQLSDIAEAPVDVISMHRPSPALLDADLVFPGMINSYSKRFFHEFKYYSDSRMRWREDVDQGVQSGAYRALHILTHPIWYRETALPAGALLRDWIRAGTAFRWDCLNENIADLDEFVHRAEVAANEAD